MTHGAGMNQPDHNKSLEWYRLLFNKINDAVFVCHLDETGTFETFIEVNDVACKRLNYSREDLLALSFYDIIDPKQTGELDLAVRDLFTKDYYLFEVNQLTRDKRRIAVELSAHRFEYDERSTVLSIARDITERKRSEKKLMASHEQFRNLASRIQTIREEERSALAREIHDELGQALTVLKIQISLLSHKLRNDQVDLKDKLTSMAGYIDQTVDSLQHILGKLRPGILDELGLVPAIEWQSQDFQEITGIRVEYILPEDTLELDEEKATALFRIYQEALTNIARHAHANHVNVTLRTDHADLVLEVTDNGIGISPGQIKDPKSMGLLGIKERTMLLSGRFEINGVRDKGTNVKVTIPMKNHD